MKRKMTLVLVLIFISYCKKTSAIIGDGGAGYAQIPYLIQILTENVKRHKQLDDIQKFERLIHEGSISVRGLLNLIPIDAKTTHYLRGIKKNQAVIQRLYGSIPKSPDRKLHRENDEMIAESITMQSNLAAYTQRQEENATQLTQQAKSMSPKGAAQATVISNAQILHALNQLIKINGQILRLQGQNLAFKNRREKEDVKNFYWDTKSLKKGFQGNQSPLKLVKL